MSLNKVGPNGKRVCNGNSQRRRRICSTAAIESCMPFARYPGEAVGLQPYINATLLHEHAARLKVEYWDTLRRFGNRTEISELTFEKTLGSFAFLDPVAVLSVLRGGRVQLSAESLIDVGGGGHTPTWLQAFLRQEARVLAFDATNFEGLLKFVRARQVGLATSSSSSSSSASTAESPVAGGQSASKPPLALSNMSPVLNVGKLTVHRQAATPSTIAKTIKSHGILPQSSLFASRGSPSMLKIDIDSIDCEIMEAVLSAGYNPELIVIETNPAYPPPISFGLRFGTHAKRFFHAGGAHHILYGCSLSHANAIAAKHGYTLLQFVIEDAYFVRTSAISKFGNAVPSGPSEAFALGNPYGYFFDPGAFRRRRSIGALGSLAPGVVSEWSQRGLALARARARADSNRYRHDAPHGGFARTIALPEHYRVQREELRRLVVGNVSELARRIFLTQGGSTGRAAGGAQPTKRPSGSKRRGGAAVGAAVAAAAAAGGEARKAAAPELEEWMGKVFALKIDA